MSAIFGVMNLDGRPASPEELSSMSGALLADGPDGGDVWREGAVGLGQRLMRFTPEDSFERQPLAGCGGNAMLVADARLDNRAELSAIFGLEAADAAVLPDSAFLMKAYEKWGHECVHQFVGEFTFAIWDARSQSLFAACSPVGERPFHYHATPRRFAFATMPRGLLALPAVPRVLNEEMVADYLAHASRTPGATFYKDIFRLRGGHHVTVGQNGLKITRYWNPGWTRRIRFKNDDDYVEAFVELFDRVVKDQLRSAGPLGVSMSGGLDSSSVGVTAASMLQARGQRLSAYTEVPRAGFSTGNGRLYADETPLVQAIAHRYPNIDLNLVRTDGHFFMEDVDSFLDHSEVPFRNTSNRVWMEAVLRTARDQGRRVLLNGYMGNFTVSWNGSTLLAELVRAGQWKRALHEARCTSGGGRNALRLLAAKGVLSLLPKSMLVSVARRRPDPDVASFFDLSTSPIHPAFASAQRLQEHLRHEERDYLYNERTDMREPRGQAVTDNWYLAQVNAGYRALFGVEGRDPTGDLRVVEFCLALPEEQCRRNGQTRQFIRRAMKERLPAEIIDNRARGVQSADWLERHGAARPMIAQELDAIERNETANAMLDTARLRRLFMEWPPTGKDERRIRQDYQSTLETGLMVGRFIRWFEERK